MLRKVLIAMAMFGTAAPAAAQESISSPDGSIVVTVDVSGEGRPNYRIDRNGKAVLTESALGFLLADQDQLNRRLSISEREARQP